jgi:hypothetical protein
MKHSFNIIKLLAALVLIIGLNSCSTNKKSLGKCRGLKALPKIHKRK